jgi:hypothetical protein
MNFEKESKKERTLQLVINTVIESIVDDIGCDISTLIDEPGILLFQPLPIPGYDPKQKFGTTHDFLTHFHNEMISRLKRIEETINWGESITTKTTPNGSLAIQIDFTKLY